MQAKRPGSEKNINAARKNAGFTSPSAGSLSRAHAPRRMGEHRKNNGFNGIKQK